MAAAKTLNGTKLLVQLGDGEVSESFWQWCLINAERGIEFTNTSSDQIIPDCTSPDDPAWVTRTVDGLSASVTGAGILDTDSLSLMWDWFESGLPKNIRVRIDALLADGGGYWGFACVLTSFSVTGARNEKATFDCTIMSDGPVTWTDVAA